MYFWWYINNYNTKWYDKLKFKTITYEKTGRRGTNIGLKLGLPGFVTRKSNQIETKQYEHSTELTNQYELSTELTNQYEHSTELMAFRWCI